MNTLADDRDAPPTRPKVWRHIVGAVVAFPLLFVGWFIFDIRVLRPELMEVNVETTMDRIRWLGVPLAVVVLYFGGQWLKQSHDADVRTQEWQRTTNALKAQQAALQTETGRREYVLEVIGMGVTVEKYRQGKLWDVLQTGTPFSSIREQDPKKYPWQSTDKSGVSGGRACDALENGARRSVEYWGVPSFYAGSPLLDPAEQPNELEPMAGMASGAETTGMPMHLLVTGPWQLSERPDQLLEQVFGFFDTHPDLPYVVVMTEDSMPTRDRLRLPGTPTLNNTGYYIPAMPDSSAVFVLARRERVEPLRPYVWDDPNDNFVRENLRMKYYEVKETVPRREKRGDFDLAPHDRLPTVAEWLSAAAAYARNPIFSRKDEHQTLPEFRPTTTPPKDWKPTPWFPIPWNSNQLRSFDSLPSLGYIHRPVFVKFEDEHGKPVKRRDARQKILEQGWQQALQTLPETERKQGPARLIGAFGNNVEQQLALEGTLHRYAEQGGPEIDTSKTAQFINTDRRLGNTGASTFFVQMALGVMGSYNGGGTSAAINLRDPSGASIVFIRAPTDARRKAQEGQHVFKHNGTPDIDPANYAPPTVGDLIPETVK